MVSFRDGLWPEIKTGRLKREAVMADVVHPNDLGHVRRHEFGWNVHQTLMGYLAIKRNLGLYPADQPGLVAAAAFGKAAVLQLSLEHGLQGFTQESQFLLGVVAVLRGGGCAPEFFGLTFPGDVKLAVLVDGKRDDDPFDLAFVATGFDGPNRESSFCGVG